MTIQRPIVQPFAALYKTIDAAVDFKTGDLFDRNDLAAVCIRMSYGNPTWCACNKSDNENIELLCTTAGVMKKQWIEWIRCKEGKLQGNVPKFVFDAARYAQLFPLLYARNKSPMEIAFWSCRWGMTGQFLPGWSFFGGEEWSLDDARAVIRQPALQVHRLKQDLEAHAKRNPRSKMLAFSRQCKGPLVNVADEWGVRTNDLANELRQRWAEITLQDDKKLG